MKREYLVGTVLSLTSGEVILREFLGEGNEQVVYSIAPRNNPEKDDLVIKFRKPEAFLEMNVLHYSLSICEELYPQHPLLMSVETRLELLTNEMLERIASGRLIYRVAFLRGLLDVTVNVLASQFFDQFESGTLDSGYLGKISGIKLMVDENLLLQLEELVDEDKVVEKYTSFFVRVIDDMKECITQWKANNAFNPFSVNPFVNLIGLFMEDFISHDELVHISKNNTFESMVTPEHIKNLFDFITILYFRISSDKNKLSKEPPKKSEDASDLDDEMFEFEQSFYNAEQAGFRHKIMAITIGCNLLEHFANKLSSRDSHLVGLARYWKAKGLLLGEFSLPEIRQLLETALTELTEPKALPDRHDVFLTLAGLYHDVEPELTNKYLQDVMAIKNQLKSNPPS